jgi:tetratricopeptide (TPR) repeat protein
MSVDRSLYSQPVNPYDPENISTFTSKICPRLLSSQNIMIVLVLVVSQRKRRDSTRIIYEILLASKDGVSKTRVIQKSNLNFKLMREYLSFLLDRKYLERMPGRSSYDKLKLTDKGGRLLDLLNQLEGEIKAFRTFQLRSEESDRGGSILDRQSGSSIGPKKAKDWSELRSFLRCGQEYQISLAVREVYSLQGQVSSEEAEIDRMLSLAQALSDDCRLAEAHAWKSNHLTRVGMYQQAILEGQRALGFASAANDKSKVAGAMLLVGEASAFLGQKDEPLQYFSEALSYYEESGDRVGLANATRLIAQVYLKHNDFSNALDKANRALSLFEEIGDRIGASETLRYLGDICCAQGKYLKGLDYYEQVLKIRRDIGNRSREGGALGDIGDVYLFLGQYEKSLDLHRQALAIDTEVGYRLGQVWDHHDLGVIQFNLGNVPQACEELNQALRHARDINAPDMIVLNNNDLSTVLRNIGGNENLESALRTASEASKIGEEYSLVFGRITGESNVAMAHRALGNSREALYHSEKAIKLLGSSGPTEVNEEEILFNHYLVLLDHRKLIKANNYLKKAHDKMMSKADRIEDSTIRKTFLTRVAVNRSITSALAGSRT